MRRLRRSLGALTTWLLWTATATAAPPEGPSSPGVEARDPKDAPKQAEAPKDVPKKAEPKKAEPKKAEPSKDPPKKAEAPKVPSTSGQPSVGPGVGAGARKLEQAPPAEPTPVSPTQPAPATLSNAPGKEAPTHRTGRAPRRPSPTLPKGVAKPTASESVRRAVALGPTLDDSRAGKDDPELRALREADRVLFPRPVVGLTPGFAWDSKKGSAVVASGLPPATELPSASSSEVAITAEWLRTLTMPNLPVRLEPSVVRYLKFYRDNSRGRAIARAWAKKSGRFAPALKAELQAAGLPTDLVWLSLIESGHNPAIFSPVGAAGLWQFMPATGRMYGLVVDRWVDERLDPKRSTEAAIGYLSDLYRRFGTWELAMAAYNMGHGGLYRSIQKFNTNDYWELSRHEAGIPWETTLYVPKIAAIAIVMNNQRAFGIADVTPDPAETFETVLVPSGTPLSRVAQAAEASPALIEQLNPQFLAARAPPTGPGQAQARWRVRVPRGKGAHTTARLARVGAPEPAVRPFVVRAGDTPESVAQAVSVRESELTSLNRIGSDEPLPAGTVLLVPARGRQSGVAEAKAPEVVVVSARTFSYTDREQVFVVVRTGDDVPSLAKALGVSVAELQSWNAIDAGARLLPSMTLQAYVPRGKTFDQARVVRANETRALVVGTPEFIDYFEGQNGKQRLTVSARAGETLAQVGKRYGMSPGWMERINRKSRGTRLAAGESVVVYVKRARAPAPAAAPATTPLPGLDAPHPDALPGTADDEETSTADASDPQPSDG